MKLNHFQPGMAIVQGRFTGRVVEMTPSLMRVRWDNGIYEVLREKDLQARGDLRPMFP